MRVESVSFNNVCGCIVDLELLAHALVWFADGRKFKFSRRKIYMSNDYPAVSINGIKVAVHRLVAMYTQRELVASTMICHHKDGNPLNSSVDNIEIMPLSEHVSLHHKGKKLSEEHCRKISIRHKGKVISLEARRKVSEFHTGRKHTEEAKKKMREAIGRKRNAS